MPEHKIDRQMKESGIEWVGQIPEEWHLVPIRAAFQEITKKNFDGKETNALKFTYGEIVRKSNFDADEDDYVANTILNYTVVNPGTIMLNGLNLNFDFVSQRIGLVKERGIITSAYMSFKPFEGVVLPEYATYLLKSYDNCKAFHNMGGGVRKILNFNEFKKYYVAYPELEEQRRIVSFLDSKCDEIDALRSDIEKEIETLEEYKKSIITEAVTKGLDSNVPMKDSGINWIGLVPTHWELYRIADLYEDRNERGNDNLPLLSVSINNGVSDKELSDEEQERVFLRSEDKTKYKRVYPGDITYNMMRAWQGAFGAVRVDGMVSPAYVVAKKTGTAEIDSRYIEALLRSPSGIEEMNRYSYGIMDFRKRLYWPQFRIIRVCLPNIYEQRQIADFIDQKAAEIDKAISEKQEQLDILDDYKKSVIYEYVTGKKVLS